MRKEAQQFLRARLQQPVLAGEEELQGLRHGVVEPPAGPVHELGAEPEHEHAELHLAERTVSVEVPLGEHSAEVVVGHGAQTQ